MSEAKEKDRILAQIKAFKPHGEIEGLSKYLYDLERDECVSAVRDEQGDLIVVRLTPLGKNFLDNGGYSKRIHSIKPKVKKVYIVAAQRNMGIDYGYFSCRNSNTPNSKIMIDKLPHSIPHINALLQLKSSSCFIPQKY